MIYSLDDMDLFDKAYWWGREDDSLFAYLNEIHKSIFYFQFWILIINIIVNYFIELFYKILNTIKIIN